MRRQYGLKVRGDVITVTSPYSGRSFKINTCDRALVDGVPWAICKIGRKLAVVGWPPGSHQRKRLSLSRIIMGAKPGERVLFKNGDATDLRRSNMILRNDVEDSLKLSPIVRVAGKTVHVTNPYSGVQFKVSREDLDLVRSYNWNTTRSCRYLARKDKQSNQLLLHRVIMAPKKGECIDFINGDTLDCRRQNLRVCKRIDTQKNRRGDYDSLSGFKGVHVSGTPGRWRVNITANGQIYHIGWFNDVIKAAKAYNRAAVRYHGEFARLNKIPRGKRK